MNCDLPERVDCGSRPRKYGDAAQQFQSSGKPGTDFGAYVKLFTSAASQGKGFDRTFL